MDDARVQEERQRMMAERRRELERARADAREVRDSLEALDDTIRSLSAAAARAAETAAADLTGDTPERRALMDAQIAYNEAVARERRAAVLGAHGIPARQELEAAQVEVRTAAAALADARRATDMAVAIAGAEARQAHARAELALAEAQQRRAALTERLVRARDRVRELEDTLAVTAVFGSVAP